MEPSLASSGFLPAYVVVDGAAIIASSPGEVRKLIDTKAAGSDVTTSPSYARALARVPTWRQLLLRRRGGDRLGGVRGPPSRRSGRTSSP